MNSSYLLLWFSIFIFLKWNLHKLNVIKTTNLKKNGKSLLFFKANLIYLSGKILAKQKILETYKFFHFKSYSKFKRKIENLSLFKVYI